MAAAPPPPPRSSAASGGRGCHVAAAVRHEAVGSHCVASAEASMRRRQPLLTALTALTPLFDFVLERFGADLVPPHYSVSHPSELSVLSVPFCHPFFLSSLLSLLLY